MTEELIMLEFERIVEAPDAVQRLRLFVLELAVRGRLVEQNPADGCTEDLIGRIIEERAQHGRRVQNFGGVAANSTDHEYQIPESWKWVPLGLIAEIVMGQSPPGSTYNMSGQGVPLINGPVEFTEGPFGSTTVNQYTTAPTKMCRKGDLLLCVRGSTTGRTNVAGFDACIGRGVAAIRPLVSDEYVRHFIWRQRSAIIAMGRGIAFPSISRDQIAGLQIPLPPLAEQARIVAKVKELMALCDQLEATQKERESRRGDLRVASLQRLMAVEAGGGRSLDDVRFFLDRLSRLITKPEHVATMRQIVLDLAVQGRLVPQGSELGPQPSFSNECETLPHGWTRVALGDILVEDSRNGYSRKPDEAVDGIPILRISAGTVRTNLVVAEEEYKLIGHISAHERDQYSLRSGDLVACRFNGNRSFVGRISLFTGYLHKSPLYPDKLIRLRVRKEIALPTLIRWFAASSLIRSAISELCATTVGNWGISATNLKTVSFPVPPLAEQYRIVAKVDELMAVCDELESALVGAQTGRERLLEALLHDALDQGSGEVATGEALAAAAVLMTAAISPTVVNLRPRPSASAGQRCRLDPIRLNSAMFDVHRRTRRRASRM